MQVDGVIPVSGFRDLLHTIRMRQWIKNLIIPLVGLLVLEPHSIDWLQSTNLIFAFMAFCLAASSIYIINDWIDIDKDRAHPTKKHRPIASGRISSGCLLFLLLIQIPSSLALAYLVNFQVFLLLMAYLIINLCYCIKVKNVRLLDMVCVSSGFTIRALTGAMAVSQTMDFWILGAITFACMALVIMKRMKELKQLGSSGNTRKVLSGYSYDFLVRVHDMFLILSILLCMVYLGNVGFDNDIAQAAGLIVISGMLLLLVERLHGNSSGDPTDFFYKNKYLSISAVGFLVVFIIINQL